MIRLRCPVCWSDTLDGCRLCQSQRWLEVPYLIPPEQARDPANRAEMVRYDRICNQGPDAYEGHAATKPELRVDRVKDLIRGLPFVEVGPGFGELIGATYQERAAVDCCRGFLTSIHDRHPSVKCVVGVAERLPIAYTPCMVADGVFQTLPYKEAFLYEVARCCTDRFIMSVGFRWNYPRRPQQGFDVRKQEEREVLVRFLEELEFKVEMRWLNVGLGWLDGMMGADYLYLICDK